MALAEAAAMAEGLEVSLCANLERWNAVTRRGVAIAMYWLALIYMLICVLVSIVGLVCCR